MRIEFDSKYELVVIHIPIEEFGTAIGFMEAIMAGSEDGGEGIRNVYEAVKAEHEAFKHRQ